MKKQPDTMLSARERQIMDVLYRRGKATAAQVREEMPEAPGYSAVRAMLRVLEDKGHVTHQESGLRYVYLPTVPHENAKRSALKRVVDTFFEGSVEQAVAALLDGSAANLSESELARIQKMIAKARKEGA